MAFRRQASDPLSELPSGEPASRRERWSAAIYISTTATLVTLVVLAVVFDQFAATGVLLIGFLSFVLTYLLAPAVEYVRNTGRKRRGRQLSRTLAVLVIYGAIAAVLLPLWVLAAPRLTPALARMSAMVPQHTARFIDQLRATEQWPYSFALPEPVRASLGTATIRVSRSVEAEARELGSELTGIRRLIPWLSMVPVVAFLLLTRWSRFRKSTTRVLPTPHLQWRGNEFLRNVDGLLAAYTRAQASAALVIAVICWMGFAAMQLPYPGTLAIAAGLLEMIPLAGPIVTAVVATAAAPDKVLPILVFLACLRILQDYAIYPRLISRAMKLHPVAVVLALWIGAALGGLVGVCLAIPILGLLQVTWRHWREYREIETLVDEVVRKTSA